MAHRAKSLLLWGAAAAGAAAAAYATYVGVTWTRYGAPRPASPDEEDPLLDRFLPQPEVAERHRIEVNAPAATTFAVARVLDIFDLPVARILFRSREVLLGASPAPRPPLHGLVNSARAMGWGLLAEVPGREIIMGAVTKPWEANVTFRAIQPEAFAAFDEPDHVKIVWTLRADPVDDGRSIFRTETRVVATDPEARRKFRRYWALLSPGILLIRFAALRPLKREAERWNAAGKVAVV